MRQGFGFAFWSILATIQSWNTSESFYRDYFSAFRVFKVRIGSGVSSGIAASKAVEVMRLLQKSRCEVSVAMTRHATEFVQPLTFRALTASHVIVDDYDPANPDPIAHINFSQNIDL